MNEDKSEEKKDLPALPATPETFTPDQDPTPEVTALLDQSAVDSVNASPMVRYSPDDKVRAYEMFLTTDADHEAIALSCRVPVFMVQHWISTERWGDRKAQFELQIYKKVELAHQRFVLDNRLTTAQRHLETARMLEEEVKKMLQDMAGPQEAPDPNAPAPKRRSSGKDMTLVRLSQALKNATDISARVVGITDMNVQPQAGGGDGRGSTLIVVGARPQPAQKPFQAKPIMATVSPSPASGNQT